MTFVSIVCSCDARNYFAWYQHGKRWRLSINRRSIERRSTGDACGAGIYDSHHHISISSDFTRLPLTNVLIGWLIGPITIIGFVLVAVGLIWMPLGIIVAWFAWVPLTFVIEIIRMTAKFRLPVLMVDL